MAKLNSNLLNSLIIDVKEFTNFINEINSLIDNKKHLSWKYPNKLSKNINSLEIIKKRKGTAGEMYILLLEIAYDRIHYVLELIVDFFVKQIQLSGLVEVEIEKLMKPKFTSPAGTINQLLYQLKSFAAIKFVNKDKANFTAERLTKSTQAQSSVQLCENCHFVEENFNNLTNKIHAIFQDNKLISHVIQARENSRAKLVEKTQWNIITRLTHGLIDDIEHIINSSKILKNENEKLMKDKNKISLNLQKIERELCTKGFEFNEVTTKLEDMKEKNDNLSTEIEERTRKNISLAELNSTLENQLAATSETNTRLEKSLAIAQNDIQRLQVGYESQRLVQTREIELLNESIKSLKSENQSIMEELRKMKIDGDRKAPDNPENSPMIDTTEDSEDVKILVPENPERDMTRQLLSNNEKIDKLQKQNERLSKTLERLRELRECKE